MRSGIQVLKSIRDSVVYEKIVLLSEYFVVHNIRCNGMVVFVSFFGCRENQDVGSVSDSAECYGELSMSETVFA